MSMLLRKHLISQPIVTDKRNEVKTDSTHLKRCRNLKQSLKMTKKEVHGNDGC